jgi:hypothetical protein
LITQTNYKTKNAWSFNTANPLIYPNCERTFAKQYWGINFEVAYGYLETEYERVDLCIKATEKEAEDEKKPKIVKAKKPKTDPEVFKHLKKRDIVKDWCKGYENFAYYKKKYKISPNFVKITILEYKLSLHESQPYNPPPRKPSGQELDFIKTYFRLDENYGKGRNNLIYDFKEKFP